MRKPLSLTPVSAPYDELPRPLLLPDDPSGHRAVDRDGWPGLGHLATVATALTASGYGISYIVESPSLLITAMLTGGPPAVLGFSVWLVRQGVANPWVRKYERWRSRAQDWRDQALGATGEIDQLRAQVTELDDLLNQAARHITGAEDPLTARRLLAERLERQKSGKRRGRPPRTPNDISFEEALNMARKIRQRHANGLSWSNAVKPFGISIDTARNRIQWLEDEELKQRDSA